MLWAHYSLSSRSTTKPVIGVGAYRIFLVFCFAAQRMAYGDLNPFTPKKKCEPSHLKEGGGEEAGREGLVSAPKLVCVTSHHPDGRSLCSRAGEQTRRAVRRGESSGPTGTGSTGPCQHSPGACREAGPGLASREGGLRSLVKLYVRTDHRV